MTDLRKQIASLERQKVNIVLKVITKRRRISTIILDIILTIIFALLFFVFPVFKSDNPVYQYLPYVALGILVALTIYSIITVRPTEKKAKELLKLFEPVELEFLKCKFMYENDSTSISQTDLDKINAVWTQNCKVFYDYASTGDNEYLKDMIKVSAKKNDKNDHLFKEEFVEASAPQETNSDLEKLLALKKDYNEGKITLEEYNQEKEKIMNK